MSGLVYREEDRSVPIPPHEKSLQTVTADYWLQIHNKQALHGEGTCFDQDGNLYFTIIYEGKVCRIDAGTREVKTIFEDPERKCASVKIHKDAGSLSAASTGSKKAGCLPSVPTAAAMKISLSDTALTIWSLMKMEAFILLNLPAMPPTPSERYIM